MTARYATPLLTFLALLSAPALAADPPPPVTARLEYVVARGCPPEFVLRGEFGRRRGYDLFVEDAPSAWSRRSHEGRPHWLAVWRFTTAPASCSGAGPLFPRRIAKRSSSKWRAPSRSSSIRAYPRPRWGAAATTAASTGAAATTATEARARACPTFSSRHRAPACSSQAYRSVRRRPRWGLQGFHHPKRQRRLCSVGRG